MKLKHLALLSLFAAAGLIARSDQPNVIFILADDLGIGDVGAFGQETIPTPRIDDMAAEGMKFTSFYSSAAVCAPARGSLMTGKHTGQNTNRGNLWVDGVGVLPLGEDDITIPEALEGSGYVTGLCGRWHLGGEMSDQQPLDNGFDYHFGKLSSLHRNKGGVLIDRLWDEDGEHVDRETYAAMMFEPMYENGELYDIEEEYEHMRPINMDEIVTAKAIEFIEDHRDDPFFLYVAYSLVHAPMEYLAETDRKSVV